MAYSKRVSKETIWIGSKEQKKFVNAAVISCLTIFILLCIFLLPF